MTTNTPQKKDLLDRTKVVDALSSIIKNTSAPYVLALDSPWGTGKTTVIKFLKADLEQKGYQCVYFNAWEVDYATDPLMALVSSLVENNVIKTKKLSEILTQITSFAKTGLMQERSSKAVFLQAVRWCRQKTQRSRAFLCKFCRSTSLSAEIPLVIGSISIQTPTLKQIEENNIFAAFNKEKELVKEFKEELGKIIDQSFTKDSDKKLVFFIDELDRCRPGFAIHLLERIKHFFDAANIFFVLSIDKNQLKISTASIYGAGINGDEYLRRFFDLELMLPRAQQTKAFIKNLLHDKNLEKIVEKYVGSDNFVYYFSEIAKAHKLSLRAIEKCINRIKFLTNEENQFDPFLIAMVAIIRETDKPLFNRILNKEINPREISEHYRGILIKQNNQKILEIDDLFAEIEASFIASSENIYNAIETIQQESANIIDDKDLHGIYINRVAKFLGDRENKKSTAPDKLEYILERIDIAGLLD